MLPSPREPLKIVRVLRKLSGYTQSNLILCDDGHLYVAKLQPNPFCGNSLANEVIGAMLLKYLHIPIPSWRNVCIAEADITRFPELNFSVRGGRAKPNPGLHFASRYLADPYHIIVDAISENGVGPLLNVNKFLDMYVFDVWANHRDRRQYILRTERQSGLVKVVFIDNSHLFGNCSWSGSEEADQPDSNEWTKPLTRSYDVALAQRVLLFRRRIPEILPHAIAHTPAEWHRSNIRELEEWLMWRLDQLGKLVKSNLRFHGHL